MKNRYNKIIESLLIVIIAYMIIDGQPNGSWIDTAAKIVLLLAAFRYAHLKAWK